MHIQDYGNIAVGSARYLARREIHSFSGSEGALRCGQNRREVITCRPSAIETTRTHFVSGQKQTVPSHPPPPPPPPPNRISIPCASRGQFLFRLCLIVFMLRGPLLFRLCIVVPLGLNLIRHLYLRYYARRLAFFFS